MGRKKKKKKSSNHRVMRWLIFLISIYFILSVMILNVLDVIHLSVLVVLVIFFDLIFMFMIKKVRLLGVMLAIIYGGFLLLLSFNVNKTVSFLNSLNLNYKTYHYSVVVLKKSDKKKLSDIAGLSLGYYSDGSKESEKALDKVRKRQETDVVSYEDTHQLANDLLDGKVEAILLEDTYLDILNESIDRDGVSFKNLVRKIYGFTIITKTSDISYDIDVTNKPFNVYISGIDTYGEISSVSRSDVNMIVSVNPSTKQILITSIPRDYYVKLHGKSGYNDKLTHAGLYGVDMSIQTLEDLLDIKINYYVKVNFSSVVKIVDAIDGVRVFSDYDFTSIDGIHYQKGYNDLNGEEALSFARERKSFAAGDRQRIKNQQALFSAVLDKVVSKNIITKYNKLLDSVHGSFVTNIKMSRLTALARMQLSKKIVWNVATNSLSGSDGSNYTYSAPSFKAYVMVPDSSSVMEAHDKIQSVFDDKSLDGSITTSGKNSNSVSKSNRNNEKSSVEKDTPLVEEVPRDDDAQLEVRLEKEHVSFVEGDEYIYHGYKAVSKGIAIDTSNGLKEEFKINDKSFGNYKDLVSYVSSLSAGNYTIDYVIQYKKEIVTLKQYVEIKEKVVVSSSKNDKEDENDEVLDEVDEVEKEEEES